MSVYGTVTGRISVPKPEMQELPRKEGTSKGRSSTIDPKAALPYWVDFAALEKRVCAAIQGTRYDVLCWHYRHAATHWVNGAIAGMYNVCMASDFSHPYTPIKWH